jgi:hypothetical protein
LRVKQEAQGGHASPDVPSEGRAGDAHGCRRLIFWQLGVVPQDQGLALTGGQLPQRGERRATQGGQAAATGR